ncbi:MAG: hypothetical protein NVS4B3_17790 [Gemmatimonadaceae bacterium]
MLVEGISDYGPVGQADGAVRSAGKREIMGYEHDRGTRLVIERFKQFDDASAGRAVQISRGLVGKEDSRGVGKGAGDGDTLLLSPGELGRVVMTPVTQSDTDKELAGAASGAGVAAELERHLDILGCCQGRNQLKALKNEADLLTP